MIQKTFYSIPGELYQLVMNRNAMVDFKELTVEHIGDLLNLLKYRTKIKFSPNVKIDAP